MIRDLWLIGIGTGSLAHITLEGVNALREAAVILMPLKGGEKSDLARIRQRIVTKSESKAEIIYFDYPERDPALPYQERVAAWHDEIAARWQNALSQANNTGPVALLVWGDPSLYDSTMRIAERLRPTPQVRVIPGITSIQALTAAHRIPLNTVDGPVLITTGRRLRDEKQVPDKASLVVMLDGECSFQKLPNRDTLYIWWGAYLGSEDQLLHHGLLSDVEQDIIATRQKARDRHGWIMDTYMLRRVTD